MTLFLGGVMFTAFMKVMYVGMYAFMGTSAVEKLEQVFSDMQKDRLTFGNKSTFKNYDIEFERVCFGYTDQMVLEDVSFTLKEEMCIRDSPCWTEFLLYWKKERFLLCSEKVVRGNPLVGNRS